MEQYNEYLEFIDNDRIKSFVCYVSDYLMEKDPNLICIHRDNFFGFKYLDRRSLFYILYKNEIYIVRFLYDLWHVDENTNLREIYKFIKNCDINVYKEDESFLLKQTAPVRIEKPLNEVDQALKRLKEYLQDRTCKLFDINLLPSKAYNILIEAGYDDYSKIASATSKDLKAIPGLGKESISNIIKAIDTFISSEKSINKVKEMILHEPIEESDDMTLDLNYRELIGVYCMTVKTSFDAEVRFLSVIQQYFTGTSLRKLLKNGEFTQNEFNKFLKSLKAVNAYDINDIFEEMISFKSTLVMTLLKMKAFNRTFYDFFIEILTIIYNFDVDEALLNRAKSANIKRPLDKKVVKNLEKFTGDELDDLVKLLRLRRDYMVKEKGKLYSFIFTNARLAELAKLQPSNLDEFITIKGFSSKVYYMGGKEFVEIIKKYNNGELDFSFMDKEKIKEDDITLFDNMKD